MIPRFSAGDGDWLDGVKFALDTMGVGVVEGVLDAEAQARVSEAMYRARDAIRDTVGIDKLQAAGEVGVLRLLPTLDEAFLDLLMLPEMLAIADIVSPTSICHLQNGLVLPSTEDHLGDIFQTKFHRDFPRILNGTRVSVNAMLAVSEFTEETGATYMVLGSHQNPMHYPEERMRQVSIPAECPAGSLVVFDSTLFHAAGHNRSGHDRLGINHQFTGAWIKPQIDYSRAMGEEAIRPLADRLQQLLGYWTRMPSSFDEFYRPADQRVYRSGQG